jgi:hypothetical protein
MTTSVEIHVQHKKIPFVLLAVDDDDGPKVHIRNVVAHGVEYSSGHYHQAFFTTRFQEFDDMYQALEFMDLTNGVIRALQQESDDRDDLIDMKRISLNVLRKQLRDTLREKNRLEGLVELQEQRIQSLLDIVRQYETSS